MVIAKIAVSRLEIVEGLGHGRLTLPSRVNAGGNETATLPFGATALSTLLVGGREREAAR